MAPTRSRAKRGENSDKSNITAVSDELTKKGQKVSSGGKIVRFAKQVMVINPQTATKTMPKAPIASATKTTTKSLTKRRPSRNTRRPFGSVRHRTKKDGGTISSLPSSSSGSEQDDQSRPSTSRAASITKRKLANQSAQNKARAKKRVVSIPANNNVKSKPKASDKITSMIRRNIWSLDNQNKLIEKLKNDVELRTKILDQYDRYLKRLIDNVRPKRQPKRRLTEKMQRDQLPLGKIDFSSSSILNKLDLSTLLNREMFSMLPLAYQYHLVQYLPKCDQIKYNSDIIGPSSTAFDNVHYRRAVRTFQRQISQGYYNLENVRKRRHYQSSLRNRMRMRKLRGSEARRAMKTRGCDSRITTVIALPNRTLPASRKEGQTKLINFLSRMLLLYKQFINSKVPKSSLATSATSISNEPLARTICNNTTTTVTSSLSSSSSSSSSFSFSPSTTTSQQAKQLNNPLFFPSNFINELDDRESKNCKDEETLEEMDIELLGVEPICHTPDKSKATLFSPVIYNSPMLGQTEQQAHEDIFFKIDDGTTEPNDPVFGIGSKDADNESFFDPNSLVPLRTNSPSFRAISMDMGSPDKGLPSSVTIPFEDYFNGLCGNPAESPSTLYYQYEGACEPSTSYKTSPEKITFTTPLKAQSNTKCPLKQKVFNFNCKEYIDSVIRKAFQKSINPKVPSGEEGKQGNEHQLSQAELALLVSKYIPPDDEPDLELNTLPMNVSPPPIDLDNVLPNVDSITIDCQADGEMDKVFNELIELFDKYRDKKISKQKLVNQYQLLRIDHGDILEKLEDSIGNKKIDGEDMTLPSVVKVDYDKSAVTNENRIKKQINEVLIRIIHRIGLNPLYIQMMLELQSDSENEDEEDDDGVVVVKGEAEEEDEEDGEDDEEEDEEIDDDDDKKNNIPEEEILTDIDNKEKKSFLNEIKDHMYLTGLKYLENELLKQNNTANINDFNTAQDMFIHSFPNATMEDREMMNIYQNISRQLKLD